MKQIVQWLARLIAVLAMAASFQAAAGPLPGAPTIGIATAGVSAIAIAFTAPADPGSSPITSYTATCGTISASGAASPINVQGLVVGQAYTCTVTATNASGAGPASTASNSAIPLVADAGSILWSTSLQGTGTLGAKIANGDPVMGRKTIALDAAGDILLAGEVHNGATNGYDWKTAKISAATGAIVWQKDFHGGFGDDHVYALAVDAAGNVVVVGTAWSATGDTDWKVIKYRAADGVLLWEKSLGSAGNDAAYLVAIDPAGDAVVGGIQANGANVDWKVVKYAAANGNVTWTQTFAGKAGDLPRALVIEPAGGEVVVAGRLSTDRPNATTVRLRANGDVRWQKTYAGPATGYYAPEAAIFDLVLNADGSVLASCTSMEGFPYFGMTYDGLFWYVFHYDADGTLLWQKPDNATGGFYIYAASADGAGGLYAIGTSYSSDADTFVARLSASGDISWSSAFAISSSIDAGVTVVRGGDGYPLLGSSQQDGKRWAVRKLLPSGALLWGGELAAADTSLLHALAAGGIAAYPFGTWTAVAGGQAALHVKRLKNTFDVNTPGTFAFADGEGEPGAWVTSRQMHVRGTPTTVTGISVPVAVTIVNGEYSINCTGPFTSAPGMIGPEQTLCLRNVAAASYGGTTVTTVTVGGVSATFKSTAKHAVTLTITINPPNLATLTTTISNVYITVTVNGTGGGPAPTGSVYFWNSHNPRYYTNGLPYWSLFCGSQFGTTLNNGTAICQVSTIQFPGPDALRIEYGGDANYQRTYSTEYPYNVARYPLTLTQPTYADQPLGKSMTIGAIPNLDAGYYPYYVALYPTPFVNTSLTPSVCATSGYFGQTLTLIGLGTCTITTDYAGSVQVAPAATATTSFLVKNPQALVFAALANRVYSPVSVTLAAVGGVTGNPVTFSSSTPAVCVTGGTNGATLSMLALGTCTIVADQLGNTDYVASPTVTQSFTVLIAPQTISYSASDKPLGSPAFRIAATGGGSGNPVIFTSQTPAVCAVSRNDSATVTLLSAGTCTLSADQAGSTLYSAAPRVTQSFQVTGAGFTLTVSKSGAGTVTSAPAGISCGATCSASFAVDQAVTLTAVATSGSLFSGWSGCPAPVLNRCTVQMNQARSVAVTFTVAGAASAIGITDFNADGKPDLLLSNGAGLFTALRMNGLAAGSTTTFTLASNLVPVGMADFNGDGHPDLLLQRPSTGEVVLAYLVNGALQSQVSLFTLAATEKIQAVADFNGDGKPDLLVRDTATGQARLRFMTNTTVTGEQALFAIAPRWRIEGSGDFTASGRPALLFRDSVSGYAFAWRTDYAGGTVSLGIGTQALFTIDPTWEVVQVADWNGDGSPDLVMRNATSGEVLVYYFDGVRAAGFGRITGINPSYSIVPRPQS